MSDIFNAVKERVPLPQAMGYYGIHMTRGFASCPFHNERTPSMSVKDNYFKCFGCGVGGDVVAFVAKYFKLSPLDAVKKINSDFRLLLDLDSNFNGTDRSMYQQKQALYESYKQWEISTYTALCNTLRIYEKLQQLYEPFSNKWCDACHKKVLIEYYLHVLLYGSINDKVTMYNEFKKRGEKAVG